MKKILLGLFISILVSSLVFAAGTDSNGQPEVAGQYEDSGNLEETGAGTQLMQETQNQVRSGNLTMQGGNQVQIQTQSNNQIQLKSGNVEAKTSMQMTQEQTQTGTKLQVKLSNGKNAEVKIMPDTASEKALERLRIKTCSAENGCSIELKEVGQGEQAKAAYEVQVQKQAKFLGLFKTKVQVQAQVNAESGEVIKTKKSWWAFLASESEQ